VGTMCLKSLHKGFCDFGVIYICVFFSIFLRQYRGHNVFFLTSWKEYLSLIHNVNFDDFSCRTWWYSAFWNVPNISQHLFRQSHRSYQVGALLRWAIGLANWGYNPLYQKNIIHLLTS
jgi:hypothetical protein